MLPVYQFADGHPRAGALPYIFRVVACAEELEFQNGQKKTPSIERDLLAFLRITLFGYLWPISDIVNVRYRVRSLFPWTEPVPRADLQFPL